MMRSWTETQALAERAARGAEVPFAQSARFGAAAARHLAENRDSAQLSKALNEPDVLLQLSLAVERAIESASTGTEVQHMPSGSVSLLQSYIESMPCSAEAQPDATGLVVRIDLSEPTTRKRPARVDVPDDLWAEMEALAKLTYVPDSAASRDKGAGAGLMELD